MVDEQAEAPWQPKHVRLYPDSKLAQASGRPIGTVLIAGVEYEVRCATMADLAWFHEKTGKNPMRGELDWLDKGPAFFAELLARALRFKGLDTGPTIEQMGAAGFSNLPQMSEVARCFLSVDPLSEGSPTTG